MAPCDRCLAAAAAAFYVAACAAAAAAPAAPPCSTARYWELVSAYYGASVMGADHLCLGPQRARGWAGLQGGSRAPELGELELHFLGGEGTGHHALSFESGAIRALPVAEMDVANVSVRWMYSFPYSSRTRNTTDRPAGDAAQQYTYDNTHHYLSRTDRSLAMMWPYAGHVSHQHREVEARLEAGTSLFVVMARDEPSATVSNLARFYKEGSGASVAEAEPYSERALDLELMQQAMAYTTIEAMARRVPCGRLFALPYELWRSDACSVAAALVDFIGRAPDPAGWVRRLTDHAARPQIEERASREALLPFAACSAFRAESAGASVADSEALTERCEEAVRGRAEGFFHRLRFMWPLQAPTAGSLEGMPYGGAPGPSGRVAGMKRWPPPPQQRGASSPRRRLHGPKLKQV